MARSEGYLSEDFQNTLMVYVALAQSYITPLKTVKDKTEVNQLPTTPDYIKTLL
jgi:hypothetical protein